mmetsp:Transcript_62181/g.180304  ORF Transcript_62181/g.180304 Transcript_62181/m.180304 type:complete len:335 (-) Transcript_62181:63-1067(-)
MEAVFREARAEARELLRKKDSRGPWQPIPVLIGGVIPSLLFAWSYYCCFAGLRFYLPITAAIVGLVVPFIVCVAITAKARGNMRAVVPARLFFVLAVCLWVAFALAALGGEVNYHRHMVSFYKFQDLASYTNIDPGMDKGQSYMDAGQVYFSEGSHVAVGQLAAFRSDSVYCAAPIVSDALENQDGDEQVEQDGHFKVPKSETVDFWAVGVDCCDQESKTFTCGAVPNPKARAGIRLLRDDVRPFYVLAVQQWIARMCPLDKNTAEGRAEVAPLICPQARHPLFFHWVQDPLDEVDNLYTKAMQMYRHHLFWFCIGNVALVMSLHFVLFEMGLK